jgi:hypothetical protein
MLEKVQLLIRERVVKATTIITVFAIHKELYTKFITDNCQHRKIVNVASSI